jgi:phosphatidate cytidylyltransferase
MLTRIITGICIIAALIPIIIFSNTWVLPIVMALVGVLCVYELSRCMGLQKRVGMLLPLYVFALGFPFLQRIFESITDVAIIAMMAVIFYVIYLFCWAIFAQSKITYPEICTLCLTSLYILFSINMIIYIRDYNGYVAFLILIGSWVTDAMAYFTGRLFGKHKLAPTVSPKKTIEGSIGGSLFCAAAFVLMGVIVGALVEGSSPNYIYLAISGLVISVISQIGDLIFSVLKRQYNVKDFSNLFPGHGGMIDRMDSVFSVALGIQAFIMLAHLTGISFF